MGPAKAAWEHSGVHRAARPGLETSARRWIRAGIHRPRCRGRGILAGLAFAWHASRADLNEALKESSRGAGASSSSHRLRGLLVVTEVALALVLLTGAGLMVEGFRNLVNQYPGYDRRNLLTFQVALPESKYREQSQVREFYDQLVQRLGALPGVEAAAAASTARTMELDQYPVWRGRPAARGPG